MSSCRVGFGFDIHKFEEVGDRPLMLGTVLVEGHAGLVGHSDADVVAHAVTDALLGAAGLGDMGKHFPDTDDRWRGVSSIEFLIAARGFLADAGWVIANVDCTIVTEMPKIAPYREAMEANMAEALGAPVNVKASRAEGLGAIGRVEGIACYAVASLEKP